MLPFRGFGAVVLTLTGFASCAAAPVIDKRQQLSVAAITSYKVTGDDIERLQLYSSPFLLTRAVDKYDDVVVEGNVVTRSGATEDVLQFDNPHCIVSDYTWEDGRYTRLEVAFERGASLIFAPASGDGRYELQASGYIDGVPYVHYRGAMYSCEKLALGNPPSLSFRVDDMHTMVKRARRVPGLKLSEPRS